MERRQQLQSWLAAEFPGRAFEIAPASADASFRRYFRVTFDDDPTPLIVMDAPPSHEDCRPYIQVAELFGAAGAHVPQVIRQNLAEGFLLLSDLGSTTYLQALTKDNAHNLYADALLSINKSFFDDKFSLSFNLGASILDDKNDGEGFEGHLATIANKFSVYNVDMSHSQTKPYADRYHDQTQAVYATAQLGYNGMVYLDVTARNEWASQLAFTPHMNIFYPSVGLSAVISSMADATCRMRVPMPSSCDTTSVTVR